MYMKTNNIRQQAEVQKVEDLIKQLGEEELLYLNDLIIERLKLIDQAETIKAMQKFNLGELVEFKTKEGTIVKGNVIKLNKKSILIRTLEGKKWKVPPQILNPAKA